MFTEEFLLSHLPTKAMTRIDGLTLPRAGSGKVREIFEFDGGLLIFATDRISAFDVILEPGIPGKGVLLTQISLHWFRQTEDIIPNHLCSNQERVLEEEAGLGLPLRLYAMAVRKLKPLPVECVVRGYLAGGGWEAYRKLGEVCGQKLPAGLRQSERLPSPIFTPTTKEAEGHDLPITEVECARILGSERFEQVRDISLRLYERGRELAKRADMILADTKFEFGEDEEGNLVLIDEVLTPDSSRYWPIEGYQPGQAQPSFDKQYVRDYLNGIPWNRMPPAPRLPEEVVQGTRDRYLQAAKQLLFPVWRRNEG